MPSSPPAAVAKPAPPAPPVLPPAHVLQLAAAGCVAALRSVLSGVDVNASDSHGRTPLHVAAAEGHAHVVALLLAHGADAARVDTHGNSPASDAARHGRIHVLQVLAAADAPIPGRLLARHLHSDTAPQRSLIDSVLAGDKRSATVAVGAFGAHVNKPNYDMRTPLHIAVDFEQHDVVKFLLAAGADPTLVDRWGNTPAQSAIASNNPHIRALFDNVHDSHHSPNTNINTNIATSSKESQLPTIHRVTKRSDSNLPPSSNSQLQSPGNAPVIKRVVTVPSSRHPDSGSSVATNGVADTTQSVIQHPTNTPVIRKISTSAQPPVPASSPPRMQPPPQARPRSAPQIVRVIHPNGDKKADSIPLPSLNVHAPNPAPTTSAASVPPLSVHAHHHHSVPPSPMDKAPVSTFRRTQSQKLLHGATENNNITPTYEWRLNTQADTQAPPVSSPSLASMPLVQETAIN